MSGERTPRMPALLSAIAKAGTLTSDDVATTLGWEPLVAQKALANAKQLGYLEFQGERVPGVLRNYALTALGRTKAFGDSAVDVSDTELSRLAAELILAEPGGMDSDALADKLGVPSFDVERALAACKQRFVTCNVFRNGENFVLYRESASSKVGSDWERTRQIGASAPLKGAHRELALAPKNEAIGVDIDAAHKARATKADAGPGVALETVTESSGGEVEDDGCEEFFCLYSTGELLVQRDSGQQVCFTPDETRALFQWLDRLGGTNLERLTAQREQFPV
jgi:hypothetical protein